MIKNISLILFGFILAISAIVLAGSGVTSYLALKRPGSDYDAYIRNETDGKLVFGTSKTAIGDIEIVGVSHVRSLNFGALADGFHPAAADSDEGLGFATDIIIDSLRFRSPDDAAGDSLVAKLYENTATATLLSTDTLTTSGTISYTGLTTAQRSFDISAGHRPSFEVDVKGTYTAGLLELFYRSYDVQ